MHRLQFLPEALLVVLIIIAEMYYQEMREYYQQPKDDRTIERYGQARMYVRLSCLGILFIVLSVLLNWIYIVAFGVPSENVSLLHYVPMLPLGLVVAGISLAMTKFSSGDFFIPYKHDEELSTLEERIDRDESR